MWPLSPYVELLREECQKGTEGIITADGMLTRASKMREQQAVHSSETNLVACTSLRNERSIQRCTSEIGGPMASVTHTSILRSYYHSDYFQDNVNYNFRLTFIILYLLV